MAWSDELDGQAQQQWHSRVAQKRLDLSASVEEALLQPVQTAQATEEIAAPVQNKPGLARRTTKVRLQVVPKPEETHRTEEFITPVSDGSTNLGLLVADKTKKSAETSVAVPSVEMLGSGTFEIGQSEVA